MKKIKKALNPAPFDIPTTKRKRAPIYEVTHGPLNKGLARNINIITPLTDKPSSIRQVQSMIIRKRGSEDYITPAYNLAVKAAIAIRFHEDDF